VIDRREKVRFKTARLSDEQICRGREFQLLREDTKKTREAKEDIAKEGTARRCQLIDHKHLDGL